MDGPIGYVFKLGNLQHSNLAMSYCVRVVAKKRGKTYGWWPFMEDLTDEKDQI